MGSIHLPEKVSFKIVLAFPGYRMAALVDFSELLVNEYFGNPVQNYLISFGMIIGFILLGRIVDFFLKNYLRRIIGRTKNKLDDIIMNALEKPSFMFFLVVGFYAGSYFLTVPETVRVIATKLVKSLLVFAMSWFVINVLDLLIEEYIAPLTKKTDTELDDQLMPLLKKLVKIALVTIAAIMILSDLGFDVTSILAGLGIGGLAFAFAARDLIVNIFGGIAIIFDRSFKINDRIKVMGVEGNVKEIGLRTTIVESVDGTKLIIPNSKIADNVIENKSYSFRKAKKGK